MAEVVVIRQAFDWPILLAVWGGFAFGAAVAWIVLSRIFDRRHNDGVVADD